MINFFVMSILYHRVYELLLKASNLADKRLRTILES